MRLALYQPDQAGNFGTILRTAACLGVAVDVIEPCGFPWNDRALRRAGMDYAERALVARHAHWEAFQKAAGSARLVLFTTQGAERIDRFCFSQGDVLLFGSESSGVPEPVHEAVHARIRIPQAGGTRSLNLAVAAGIGLTQALRQTNGWPDD